MQALSVINAPLPKGGLYDVDVRAKMLVCVLASMGTVVLSSLEGQLVLVLASLVYALGMRRPTVLLWAYVAVACMCALAIGCTWLMRLVLPQLLRDVGWATLLVPFLRLLVMVHVVLPLALSCRIQNILDALRGLRLPFCLYLPAAVAVRFIPTFLHDIKQVSESLKLRGHKLGLWNALCHPVLTLRLVCAPLLFRSLRASEELGIAAELKGLGYGGRMTPYRENSWSGRDTLFVLAALLAVAAAFVCPPVLGGVSLEGMR